MNVTDYLAAFDRRDWQTREKAIPAVAGSDLCETTVVVSASREKATEVAGERENVEAGITDDEFHDVTVARRPGRRVRPGGSEPRSLNGLFGLQRRFPDPVEGVRVIPFEFSHLLYVVVVVRERLVDGGQREVELVGDVGG